MLMDLESVFFDEKEKNYLIKAIDAFNRRIVVISPDFKILSANTEVMGMLGNDILGEPCYEMLFGRFTPCEYCPAREVLKTRLPNLMNGAKISKEFDRALCMHAYPILRRDDEETVEAVVMLDFDLPVCEGLEEKLKRANAFLKNLILSAVDGVVAADMNGKVFVFNDAAARISGYTVEEALAELNIRNIYPEGVAQEIMSKLRSEACGGVGKLKSYRVNALGKDGKSVPISLNAAIVYEDGEEVATIGFFHDLRETFRMEKELEKAQVQLVQAEKMASLGKLAAGVAHQLNNPLGGIILFSRLIMEEYNLPREALDDLDRILRDAQRCRDTVKELLEFARQTRNEKQPTDINKAISRTLFLLENQSLFQNIRIVKDFNDSLPQVPVDIQQMNHVFMNLILNAAQAMEGKGTLTIRTNPAIRRGRIIIEISDTGPGIPEAVLPHIFEPFYTTKEEGKGTGLGLSLAYGIVENHGGRIMAVSRPGEGATFYIELKTAGEEDEHESR